MLVGATEDTEDFLKEEESSHSQSSLCTPKLCEDIKKPPQAERLCKSQKILFRVVFNYHLVVDLNWDF